MPEAAADVTEALHNVRSSTHAEIRQMGLKMPVRPKVDVPHLPSDLADIDDGRLMRLLVLYTRYQDHLDYKRILNEIEEKALEKEIEIEKARGADRNYGDTERVQIAKAQALIDPKVLELETDLQYVTARRKLLGILVDSMARDAAVVSREISRRVGRDPVERRSDRFHP